ncbi:hypothetical protein MO973_05405 [Paenibacillus sp. TRM 82003]|nr:hypothetical protein [Paenibacillus sp. TRM 82003]
MTTVQVFSTFEHSSYLELAISLLEKKGFRKDQIVAIPLDNRTEDRKILDTLHRSDGVSLIDIGMALATAFAVICASIRFVLAWGPIYWGLIGAAVGFLLGFGIKLFLIKVKRKKQRLVKGKHSEVILIVDCEEHQVELVEGVLWDHFAIGVAKMKMV